MTMYSTKRFAFQDTPLSKWKAVNLALECAIAAREQFRREQLQPAEEAFAAVRSQWPCESQLREGSIAQIRIEAARAEFAPVRAEFDTLHRAVIEAADEAIATPAPSMAAMAIKLRLLVEDGCGGTRPHDETLSILLADARRLSGETV